MATLIVVKLFFFSLIDTKLANNFYLHTDFTHKISDE